MDIALDDSDPYPMVRGNLLIVLHLNFLNAIVHKGLLYITEKNAHIYLEMPFQKHTWYNTIVNDTWRKI